jgi:uncharacterized protein YjbI with pentapeptide repeats
MANYQGLLRVIRSVEVLMLKTWAAWPRGIRWLIGTVAVLLAVVIVWALFMPAADWLAHHDVGSAGGPLLQTARDAARGRLLTLGAGLVAAGALLFTARSFLLSREGQVTDRYTKAITQLGDEKLDVRIGGIYALERIARDSAKDHPTVIEVLTAFIRDHSNEWWPPVGKAGAELDRSTRPDIQAAVTVVGRRNAKRDIRPIDLTRAVLAAADLLGANLRGAVLAGADLRGTVLAGADLRFADLAGADLRGARLASGRLYGADLTNAHLEGAGLYAADLAGARLSSAHFAGANLDGAILPLADLAGADLNGASLVLAQLDVADPFLARLDDSAKLVSERLDEVNLTGADLTGVKWPADTPPPDGWKPDISSGRLERAGTDSGSAEAN